MARKPARDAAPPALQLSHTQKQKPHKPDALSRLMRLPQQKYGAGKRPLLLSGFLGQVIGSFAGMAHQDGARTGNLTQTLEVGLHLETCGLEL